MVNGPRRRARVAIVVDDETGLLDVLKATLTEEGRFRVVTAATPELVLPVVEATAPGIVLLDINLPGQSGWEILAALRRQERFKTLPVLIITAMQEAVQRVAALNDPWVDLILKPFDLDALLQHITHLTRSAAR